MKLLDKEINNLKLLCTQSDERLAELNGGEFKAEEHRNNKLHWKLRKYTTLANDTMYVFFCSRCGEQFKSNVYRIQHVKSKHKDDEL